MFYRFILLFILLFTFSFADETVKIGVLAKRASDITLSKWSSTAKYLTQEIENYKFQIVPLNFEELIEAVKKNKIDFVLTNTAYYVELEYLYGVSRIATLKNLGSKGEVLTQFGGVIFTKKDSSINSLEALKYKTFGAVNKNSFGGWIMAQKELLSHGITVKNFKSFQFLDSHDNVVKAVESGEIDAGTVRTDTLERMANEKLINLDDFKILSKKSYAEFPFKVSTSLYPEWPFAKLSNTSDELTSSVIIALLKMPKDSLAAKDAKIAGWTTPLDYSKVHQLMEKLRIGPYKAKNNINNENNFSFSDYMRIEELIFSLTILLIFGYFIFKLFQHQRVLDIKLTTFNILLVIFELGMIFFLIYELLVLDRLENQKAQAYKNQYKMLQVADILRQSSDDLTHFARSYVVTKNQEFEENYYKVLAIRNGTIQRPQNYDGIYWDLEKDLREVRHPSEKKISLKTIFKSLPFKENELEKLKLSEDHSNDLANLEVSAFNLMKYGGQKKAIEILHSKDYYEAKQRIMLPIDEMMNLVKVRTNEKNLYLEKMVNRQVYTLLIVGFIFIVGNIIIYMLIRKKVNKPIKYLTEVIKSFEVGNENIKKKTFYNDEVGYMIDNFFKMHQAIKDSEKAVQELLERMQESIDYSALIQEALIPKKEKLEKNFGEYFAILEQRDVVGGDIFLLEELNDEDEVLLMVIDCTGHGVPGALMSVLVKAIERQMVSRIRHTDEEVSPAKLLNVFNNSIKHLLHQDKSDAIVNVGFDGTILHYNKKENLIRWSGANSTLFLLKDDKVEEFSGDRQSIGYRNSDENFIFTDHEIKIDSNISIYLPTDGYLDQNGGDKGFPFGKKRFIKVIEEYNNLNMEEQKTQFLNELTQYQGSEQRNDDVTLFAFKVNHQA